MDADEEDYVFYGTPIEREEDITSRKKKALAESAGNLRSLPPWKQEVIDEEGRRRFHGAFTGGFSAGYYNTVGSKEGWAPQSFTSSRKNRAEVKQQSILNFLDDDEKAELEGHSLGTSSQFDTFGFTAAEIARKQAEKEQEKRPSVIPGPVPNELVLPAAESIGVKLLLKMGWRHGRSIRNSHTNSLYDARREARKAFLALSSDDATAELVDSEHVKSDLVNDLELPAKDDVQSSQSTPVYVLNPKQDLHGLGYDPFKHAPEFREKKRSRTAGNKEMRYKEAFLTKENLFSFKSGNVAPGFGIGALEELDAEDEDVYATSYDYEDTYVQEIEEPLRLSSDHKQRLAGKEKGILPGFKVASSSDYQLERFDPPVIPKDFVPHHKFPASLETDNKFADLGPPEVPPPGDNNLKVLIEGVASLVARCGKLFEDLSREKNQSNPLFCFLTGGNGHEYYTRKLWEERKKRTDQTKIQVDGKSFQCMQKLTAETRGKILGERPLGRSPKESSSSVASAGLLQLQLNLSDTFTKPASHNEFPEVAKPFKDDPAKQERFEQFLKEKYQGGLRTTLSSGASNMSEAARARERLDFEAAVEAMNRGKWDKESYLSIEQSMGMSATAGMQFTSGGVEQDKVTQFTGISVTAGMQFTSGGVERDKVSQAEGLTTRKIYPKREVFQWQPAPILCKRFNIVDPYMGKPRPPPRMRSKMDTFMLTEDSMKATEFKETADGGPLDVSQSDINKEVAEKEEVNLEVENVERPVDLYKAIFSDDSDDEEEKSSPDEVGDPQRKVEAANATLNRLIAGDFLQSLGKELGLEVPPDVPYSVNKAKAPAPKKESINANGGDTTILPTDSKDSSTQSLVSGTPMIQGLSLGQPHHAEIVHADGSPNRSGGKMEFDSYKNKSNKPKQGNMGLEVRRAKKHTHHHKNRTKSSSSEDERSRKHSSRHRRKSSSSESDLSGDYQDQYHSKGRKKESFRGSSSSRRHSKHHHKRERRDSPNRSSHHGTGKERTETGREKRKWRD
ncbi:G patch domain-containing protein TGH [Malania oleifera]|uniref:G patch domain-containing protein TGH n=1 Tax=Malania oleifera TaxID=397392 RepID=UPI0025AD9DA2|nr:G patch domain-containing protein TGH [Malania oleifera]